jgi:hypothetical protein
VSPGGRNSCQKAQKGPQKKKSWSKEFVAKFYQKVAEKGPQNFQKKFLIFIYDNHV